MLNLEIKRIDAEISDLVAGNLEIHVVHGISHHLILIDNAIKQNTLLK